MDYTINHPRDPRMAECDIRAQVLIGKITKWLNEHPDELSQPGKIKLTIHIAGDDIVPIVEHRHEKR